jgi:hypothetical protein
MSPHCRSGIRSARNRTAKLRTRCCGSGSRWLAGRPPRGLKRRVGRHSSQAPARYCCSAARGSTQPSIIRFLQLVGWETTRIKMSSSMAENSSCHGITRDPGATANGATVSAGSGGDSLVWTRFTRPAAKDPPSNSTPRDNGIIVDGERINRISILMRSMTYIVATSRRGSSGPA